MDDLDVGFACGPSDGGGPIFSDACREGELQSVYYMNLYSSARPIIEDTEIYP